jgi:hypothetical protein
VAEPVPEPVLEPEVPDVPEPLRRPVLSPDPQQTWRPSPRRRAEVRERRALWQLESKQYVLFLMLVVSVVMLIMLGVLLSEFMHAASSHH